MADQRMTIADQQRMAERIVFPDGWEATDSGMRSSDGKHSLDGFRAHSDKRGERLIITDGNGTVTASERIITGDLADQLEIALRRVGVEVSDRDALGRFGTDLLDEAYSAAAAAREDFYGRLCDGDLYALLAASADGIGPREPGNVADVMREGPQPKPMLVDEWLIAAELHWVIAEPEGLRPWPGGCAVVGVGIRRGLYASVQCDL
jgi:hypothetical protein